MVIAGDQFSFPVKLERNCVIGRNGMTVYGNIDLSDNNVKQKHKGKRGNYAYARTC